jgi:CDGSH-type Zn-finger protein/truncated hemoglobin YjbI
VSDRPDPPTDQATHAAGAPAGEEVARFAARVGSLVARLGTAAAGTTDIAPAHRERVLARLRGSVLRPLRQAAGSPRDAAEDEAPAATRSPLPAAELDAATWGLAVDVSRFAQRDDAPVLIIEAAAALQDLACGGGTGGAGLDAARVASLRALQVGRGAEIITADNGPYLARNVELVDWLGVPVVATPTVALCRCGGSAMKPWCDGSHATNGFSDAKDDRRVPDHRDVYEGRQVVVADNRGTCAHSGFCTDRVAGAFRTGAEPFVAPSGARLDEILRAVRACPSGALGMRLLDDTSPAQADQQREPSVEISRNGPYRVRGRVLLRDSARQETARGDGASAEHYSLCRCGHSLNKPFCSGMHWYVDFKDPEMPSEPTIFEWAGGVPALNRMTQLFFEKYVPEDPLLGAMFGEMAVDLPERVAAWMAEVFGGPAAYTAGFGDEQRMRSAHHGAAITEEQRARWVALLQRCADEAGLPSDAEFRSAFTAYVEWGTRTALAGSATR